MAKVSGELKTSPAVQRSPGTRAASIFVGREEEMRRLTAVLHRVAAGHGATVYLTGEPGIGKTRLAREALALARARGFMALEGQAYPQGLGLAYAPILEAFDPLLSGMDASRLEALVSGLPDLGRLFGLANLPLPQPLGDHALEKSRLFWAISRLIERLTQNAPLALFIDDLHWADPASLELFHYLVRSLASHRVLILATYREPSPDGSGGLRALTGGLLRGGLAEELVVPRLERGGVDQLVRGILGGQVPGDLISILEARAGGTPLFIESFIGALVDSGGLVRSPSEKGGWKLDAEQASVLPQTVRRLVLERLARLAPIERHLLDLIAVLGDATSHSILRAASHLEEDALLDALQRLQAIGLVSEGRDRSDVVYSVTHPLIQEVAYNELPEMVRRRAHLMAIKAIESLSEGRPETMNRLARHYCGAGPEADPGRALPLLLAAGDRALALYANDEAAQHYEAALLFLKEGLREGKGLRVEEGVLTGEGSTLPALLERLGEARDRIGKREAALEIWREALPLWERAGDTLGASRIRARLAEAEAECGHLNMAEGHLRDGFAMLTDRQPCEELVGLHMSRSYVLYRLGDAGGLADTAAQLLLLAGQLASPRAEVAAHLAVAQIGREKGDVAMARERALHALQVAEQAQDLASCLVAHCVLGLIGMRLGEHHFMRYHCERGLALASRLGVPVQELWLRHCLALANFLSGAWSESLRGSIDAIALARRTGEHRYIVRFLAIRAMILALQGDLSEAEACLSEARLAVGGPSKEGPADRYVFGLVGIAETTLALEQQQAKRALALAQSFVPSAKVEGLRSLAPQPAPLVPTDMPIGLMLLAEAQVAAGEPEAALETASSLMGLSPTDVSYLTALAARAEGLAQRALDHGDLAILSLARAYETFIDLEMPFEAARSLLEQAEVREQGTGAQGSALIQPVRQSLSVFESLGARRYADRARRLLRGLKAAPHSQRRTWLKGSGLSEREIEIARLAAQGLTAGQIADRLFVSQRTVTTHMENIYTRLGINSRAALTRYVVETGLVCPTENT